MNGDPIDVYNSGEMTRDFTYIDDIIAGVVRVMDRVPSGQSSKVSGAETPYKLYNIGNNNPVTLTAFIEAIEGACDRKAVKNFLSMQPGDVPVTYADIDSLVVEVGFKPDTSIHEGLTKFVGWFNERYGNNNST
jgi:UDP-glucuronate 4-epimerase